MTSFDSQNSHGHLNQASLAIRWSL